MLKIPRFLIGIIIFQIFVASCLPENESPAPSPTESPLTAETDLGDVIVESLEVRLFDSFPPEVSVVIKGQVTKGCFEIEGVDQSLIENMIGLSLITNPQPEECQPEPIPFEETAVLDVSGLESGTYVVNISGLSGTFTLSERHLPDPGTAILAGRVWRDNCAQIGEVTLNGDPPSGCQVGTDGILRANGVFDSQEVGISKLIIELGQGLCPATGLATTLTDVEGKYLFSGLNSGTYCLSIDSGLEQNSIALLSGSWSFPLNDSPGFAEVYLMPNESKLDFNFGWQNNLNPPPENPELKPIATAEPNEACINEAEFIADINIPDFTLFTSGEAFTKSWQLQNSGTCSWTPDYRLALVGGHRMGAPEPILLGVTVLPEETVDISIEFVAPLEPGNYRGDWKLEGPQGDQIGVGPNGEDPFWIQIIVSN